LLASEPFPCYFNCKTASPAAAFPEQEDSVMSLKVELKPGERLIIGQCIITNSDQRTRLFIDGKAPILREKDILTIATADTPAKRIYLTVQLMYLEDDTARLRDEYFRLVNEIIHAAPSMISLINGINNEILTGALKQDSLDEALLYNRRIWNVFLTSVTRDDNPLPATVRQNIANLGLFVMNETRELGMEPSKARLLPLININRQLAAGLRGSEEA
jgi:flagellar protein FlbT